MRITFTKYQGTGNDFILVDNRDGTFRPEPGVVTRLCDRHFGIGSDGLILIEADEEADFSMNFFNPDGSKSFCGNGSRCAVDFFRRLSPGSPELQFRAIDGLHRAVHSDSTVKIRMGDVRDVRLMSDGLFIDTGSPHVLRYVSDPEEVSVVSEGRLVRYSPEWMPSGVNVNFIGVAGTGHILMRTYERGVEDETLSCGTGVTAAALSYHHLHGGGGEITVDTRGGRLTVVFAENPSGPGYTDIWLCGPATMIFSGEIETEL